jgi:hypothetical protein
MMRILILILLAVSSIAVANEVYRWVDKDGQIHYSDRPHEGAEMVTLPSAQTFSMPASQTGQRTQDKQKDKQAADLYSSVAIVSPGSDEVLWGTDGTVKVSASVQPQLRRGHKLMIYLDNRAVASLTGTQREAELTDVFRGEHTLRSEVADSTGSVVAKSDSVSFTVKQTSIQNPNNPNIPRSGPR